MAHNLSTDQGELSLNFDRLLLAPPSTSSLAGLHPNFVQSFKLWNIFLENVNPLTKIIHVPSVQKQMMEVVGDIDSAGKGFEALLFAIYCGALNSMTEDEVRSELDTEKTILWNRCRIGAQQALINARFTATTDLLVLQALLLFIVRFNKGFKFVVSCLTGAWVDLNPRGLPPKKPVVSQWCCHSDSPSAWTSP